MHMRHIMPFLTLLRLDTGMHNLSESLSLLSYLSLLGWMMLDPYQTLPN